MGESGSFIAKMFYNYAKRETILRIFDKVKQRDKDSGSILTPKNDPMCSQAIFVGERFAILKMLLSGASTGNAPVFELLLLAEPEHKSQLLL